MLDPDVDAGAVEDAFVIQRHAVLPRSGDVLGRGTGRQSSGGAQGNIHAESDGEVCTERVLMHAFEVLRAPDPPIARDGVQRPDQSPAECYNSGRGDQDQGVWQLSLLAAGVPHEHAQREAQFLPPRSAVASLGLASKRL